MKKQSKKLVLHRETLRRLDSVVLEVVKGGDMPTCHGILSGCESCFTSITSPASLGSQ